MQWGAVGATVAASVAAGLGSASAAMAFPVVPIAVGCSVTALGNAINFAPSDAVLVLKPGCFYGLTGALPNVTSNITIEGSNDTIADVGGGTYTALKDNGAQLIIDQLTFRGFTGNTNLPGALNNNGGTVTITKSTFADNDGSHGGAILNNNSGTLTASSTTFGDNEATNGGAIYNRNNATATLNTDVFLDNEGDLNGGAVYVANGHVTVTGTSSSTGNSTAFAENLADGGAGGAIDNVGGVLTVTFANFTENEADTPAGFGGAIFNGGGTSSVANSGFTGNFAEEDGGAIATFKSLSLSSDTLSLNRADDDGGGIYVQGGTTSLNKTDVFANSAGTSGGGIYRSSGNVSLTNGSLVTRNHPNNCTNVFC